MIFESSLPIFSDHTIEVTNGLSRVIGDPSGVRFPRGSTVTIHSWGSSPFSSMEFMFEECEVTILCDESPVFSPGCSLKGMFRWCANFNHDISHWDTSNITNMRGMFDDCGRFNHDLRWNTSNVTDMSYMLAGCTRFNQNLRWNTSKVTDMSYMFFGCRSFSRNLQWDTSKVTDMRHMFHGCRSFRRNLQWDTSKVTNMYAMFGK